MPNTETVDSRTDHYEYAAKVVCGPLKGVPKTVPLNSGTYYTAINIHNPGPAEAKFRVKVAVALPGQSGPVSAFHDFTLRGDGALELDCPLIHKLAEQAQDSFIKGFAVMLMLGIATSLFTGIFCSRVALDWLVRGLKVERLRVG